jgi:hypothetical protein
MRHTADVEQAKVELDALIREHEAEQRKRAHIEALEEERRYNQAKLQHAIDIGPKGTHRLEIPVGNRAGHGHFLVDRSGAQLRREAEEALKAIDVEIERVARVGIPDPREGSDTAMLRFPTLDVR